MTELYDKYTETDQKESIGTSEDEKKAAFARRFIESCVFRYKIFMDTCSLLDPCAGMFWDTIVPFLMEYGKYVIIPKRCIEEVDKQITNKIDPDLSYRAQTVHAQLFDLSMRHLVQVHGERTDGFADSVFLTVGAKFRTVHDMMLVTQDRTLAREFEALGESQAVRTTHSIIARRINRFGFLSPFREQIMQSDEIADNEVGGISDADDEGGGQLELIAAAPMSVAMSVSTGLNNHLSEGEETRLPSNAVSEPQSSPVGVDVSAPAGVTDCFEGAQQPPAEGVETLEASGEAIEAQDENAQ